MAAFIEPIALKKYYENLRNEVWENLNANEEGSTREQTFTQYVIDLLAEAGEVENARECRDEKLNKAGQRMHKINGYSLSEDLETVQLFFTNYKGGEEMQKIFKAEIDSAVNQSSRFLKNSLNGYFEEMEPTAPAFDFARELSKSENDIQRAEIFILTDGECEIEKPKDQQIRNVLVMYRIIDVRYLMRLEGGQLDPIEIDFEELCGAAIPCLTVPADNEDYQAYLAVVPGDVLADVYKRYGARLLEMNVRSFLQFRGKINKGIRETIMKEPHMFLAFNNGIAATAQEVELVDLPQGGKGIKSVRELQIVNGGQTTASILHTRHKGKVGIDKVFVQMKLSVIKNQEAVSTIVNRISRYANSQNKVSDADLTANSPFHIEVEKLSRIIWAPPLPGMGHQTRWFYERARGQYQNELAKEVTKKQKSVFFAQTPKNQVLVKEDLAKYVNVWAGLPFHVVRGGQKNYAIFMNLLKKKDLKPNNVFFEDLIAKAVLFRAAEKIYGIKPNALGDLRYVTVPYTLAYLNQATQGQLDLLKIWKQQRLSVALSEQLRNLMIQIESFIKTKAPGSLYGEWAKREICWEAVSKQKFDLDFNALADDLASPGSLKKREVLSEDEANEIITDQITEYLRGIPAKVWNDIDNWGRITGKLTPNQRTAAFNIMMKVKSNRPFLASELQQGPEIVNLAMEQAPELFKDIDEDPEEVNDKPTVENATQVTLDVVRQVVAWDRRHKRLKPHYFLYMKDIAEGKKPLSEQNIKIVLGNIERLSKFGFHPEE